MIGPAGIGLVWPAAGVAAVWFCAQRRARARWADVAALPLTLAATTLVTGTPTPVIALAFGLAGVVQAMTFCWLLSWWRPNLWGARGTAPMRSPRDLWGLLGAAVAFSLPAATTALAFPVVHPGMSAIGR
ncbi:hypothetical protein [Krasilnikovia sp. MM14-A1004]|uniref:hypothetical protein n=1 Tax=Krasilnikovia sp. MM14-A1004 TaxID=3373541 RepID=UPI00399CE84E